LFFFENLIVSRFIIFMNFNFVVAPEMKEGRKYGKPVDVYALGVLAHVLYVEGRERMEGGRREEREVGGRRKEEEREEEGGRREEEGREEATSLQRTHTTSLYPPLPGQGEGPVVFCIFYFVATKVLLSETKQL
jgi:hypothetical protein